MRSASRELAYDVPPAVQLISFCLDDCGSAVSSAHGTTSDQFHLAEKKAIGTFLKL